MAERASSAEPQALYRFADLARRSTDRLRQVTRRVDLALNGFTASCAGVSPLIDPQLTDKLRRYVDYVEPWDAWVRQVGRAFADADAGDRKPLLPNAPYASTDTPTGRSAVDGGSDAVIGKPGGGVGRVARTTTCHSM